MTLQARERRHPEEVVHAARGSCEQRHVGVGAGAGDVVLAAVTPAHPRPVLPSGPWGDVGLDAHDRLDAVLLRLLPELVGAEDVAVVGRRDRGHPHPRGLGEEVFDLGGTVEHRVLGVHVKVHEGVAARGAGRHWRLQGTGAEHTWERTTGLAVAPAGAGRYGSSRATGGSPTRRHRRTGPRRAVARSASLGSATDRAGQSRRTAGCAACRLPHPTRDAARRPDAGSANPSRVPRHGSRPDPVVSPRPVTHGVRQAEGTDRPPRPSLSLASSQGADARSAGRTTRTTGRQPWG
jgi:hypothetical protein